MRQTIAALAVLTLIVPGLLLLFGCSSNENGTPLPAGKAAIIDQLTPLYPNEDFIRDTITELEDHGFVVDVFSGEDIDIEFYRTLPDRGYKFIIIRSHSGLLGVDPEVVNKTWIFTNEEYDQSRHIGEQLTDSLTYGKITESSPWVFTFSAGFVSNSMEGTFDNTVIVMMGCSGLYRTDMARAFVDKGASFYLAWDGSVVLGYVDSATGVLLEELCSEELSIASVVVRTMNTVGPDPEHGAILKHYPIPGDDQTLTELMR